MLTTDPRVTMYAPSGLPDRTPALAISKRPTNSGAMKASSSEGVWIRPCCATPMVQEGLRSAGVSFHDSRSFVGAEDSNPHPVGQRCTSKSSTAGIGLLFSGSLLGERERPTRWSILWGCLAGDHRLARSLRSSRGEALQGLVRLCVDSFGAASHTIDARPPSSRHTRLPSRRLASALWNPSPADAARARAAHRARDRPAMAVVRRARRRWSARRGRRRAAADRHRGDRPRSDRRPHQPPGLALIVGASIVAVCGVGDRTEALALDRAA